MYNCQELVDKSLKRSFRESVKLKNIYKTNKLSMFCNTKDNISVEQKSNVIYRITCPGCIHKYVGKTDRNLITRLDEHGSNCSALNDHILCYLHFQMQLLIPPSLTKNYTFIMP